MLKREFIPNAITLGRALAIPLLVFLMIDIPRSGQWLVAAVFAFAAFSDFLDGYLSRRWHVESDFGRLVDPLADKLLVMAALVMLVGQRDELTAEPWLPAWLVVLILARELWVTGIRSFLHSTGETVLAADSVGKVKSLLQMVGIIFVILYGKYFAIGDSLVPLHFVGLSLISMSVVLSYWSAVAYSTKAFLSLRSSRL